MPETIPLSYSTVVALATIAAIVAALALRHIRRIPHRRIQRLRRRYLPLVGRVWPRALADKTEHRNELVYVTDADVGSVVTALRKADFAPNPFSTLKYRTVDGDRQYSLLSWRYVESPTARRQLHVYAFRNSRGGLDLYAHEERSWSDSPTEHMSETNQVAGDPDGKLRQALDDAYIEVNVV